MKKMNRKLCLLSVLLLSAALLFSACEKTTEPSETTGNVTTNAPEVTETPTETPTEPETEAPKDESLSAEQITEILRQAAAATEAKNTYKTVMNMSMSMMGEDMGVTKLTEIRDGDNCVYIEEAEGISSTAILLSDKVYFSDSYEGETQLSVVSLTADQREWVLSQLSESSSDAGEDFGPENFTGLSGVKKADGTVVITATGLSDELMSQFMGDMSEDAMMELTLTVNACELTVNAEGLIAGMTLDMAMSGSMEEEGFSMEISVAIKASVTAEYEGITVSAPENATDYEPTTFESYFLMFPSAEEAAAVGLPLDQDRYVIGEEGSAFDADTQYMQLSFSPLAYKDKTFVIYGTVGEDEELGVPVINVGEFGTFYFYCPAGISAPVYGDSVKITATFENTVDKGYDSDYLCFTMMVSECEVLGHGVGPNGGRIMFITATSLNVRTSSDTSSSDNILGTLSQGDTVEVFDQDAKGWWRIEFNGQTAYISNKYVSETRP